MRLPADWEMLQYSLKLESGRCAFADRQGFRFEMTWRRVDGPPDYERMLSDYLSKLSSEGMEDGRRIENAGHAGLAGRTDGNVITRFGCYAAGESCLVELLFPWPGERDKQLEADILGSFGEEPVDRDGCRRWRAFGMDVRAPSSLTMGSCRAEPAFVEWQFVNKRRQPVFRCARRGMVSEWMTGSLQSWLARDALPHTHPPARWKQVQREGHAVARVDGRARPRGWFRHKRHLQAEAWTCPKDGRLYSWRAEGATGLPERPLNCCGEG